MTALEEADAVFMLAGEHHAITVASRLFSHDLFDVRRLNFRGKELSTEHNKEEFDAAAYDACSKSGI